MPSYNTASYASILYECSFPVLCIISRKCNCEVPCFSKKRVQSRDVSTSSAAMKAGLGGRKERSAPITRDLKAKFEALKISYRTAQHHRRSRQGKRQIYSGLDTLLDALLTPIAQMVAAKKHVPIVKKRESSILSARVYTCFHRIAGFAEQERLHISRTPLLLQCRSSNKSKNHNRTNTTKLKPNFKANLESNTQIPNRNKPLQPPSIRSLQDRQAQLEET